MNADRFNSDWKKAFATNSTSSSFAALIPTVTEPSGDGIWPTSIGGAARKQVECLFFGAGADNATFDVQLIGWKRLPSPTNASLHLWIPTLLASFTCTIDAVQIGIAGAVCVATDLFVDTIVAKTGTTDDGINIDILSPAGSSIGQVTVDLKGSQKLQFSFDMTGATNGNALFALL